MEEPSKETQISSTQRKPGPRTLQGKRNSSYNALRTGIFAKIVLSAKPFSERREDFDSLLARLRQSLAPHDHFEELLVEALALELLKLARTYVADAEFAPLLFGRIRTSLIEDGDDEQIARSLDEQPPRQEKFCGPELLMRYQVSIWRQIDKIMARLDQWRRLRANSPTSVDGGL